MVHRGIGNHNAGVLFNLGAASADSLFKDEAVSDKRIAEGTSGLLDELDVVKVSRSVKSHDSIDSQVGELLAIMQEKLGAEGSERDVFQVFLEKLCIGEVVN